MSSVQSILPDDLHLLKAINHEQQKTIDQKDKFIHNLQQQIKTLMHQRYGRKTETINPEELLPFIKDLFLAGAIDQNSILKDGEDSEAETQATKKKKPKGHGRKAFPSDLPRDRVEHDIPDNEKECSCCDQPLTRISEIITEQLDYKPASLRVIEHVQLQYACTHCKGEMALGPKPPMPIEKGIPGAGLLSFIFVSKYLDHMPHNRLHHKFKRFGVDIARTTMCDWQSKITEELLYPLYKLMHQQILKGDIILTDDTPVKKQNKIGKKISTARIWCYLGSKDYPYQVFDYTPTRQREGPLNFLKGYEGYLQADAYPGYDIVYKTQNVIEALCWAHARRKFYDARDLDKDISHTALAYIKQLYEIESSCKKQNSLEKFKARQLQSLPILEKFYVWLEEAKKQMLPKNKLQEAVQYCLNHWQALLTYAQDGNLTIDNNASERMMKQTAVGRNYVHLFIM